MEPGQLDLLQPSENQVKLTCESSSRDRETGTSNPDSSLPSSSGREVAGEKNSLGRSRQDDQTILEKPQNRSIATATPRADQNTYATPRPVLEPARALATEELLLALPGRCDLTQEVASRLVHDFGTQRDGRHWANFHEIAMAAALGQIGTAHLTNAYRQAMRPGIRVRGAKFWSSFKALEILDHPEWQDVSCLTGSV
jgi:hypothetical protein